MFPRPTVLSPWLDVQNSIIEKSVGTESTGLLSNFVLEVDPEDPPATTTTTANNDDLIAPIDLLKPQISNLSSMVPPLGTNTNSRNSRRILADQIIAQIHAILVQDMKQGRLWLPFLPNKSIHDGFNYENAVHWQRLSRLRELGEQQNHPKRSTDSSRFGSPPAPVMRMDLFQFEQAFVYEKYLKPRQELMKEFNGEEDGEMQNDIDLLFEHSIKKENWRYT